MFNIQQFMQMAQNPQQMLAKMGIPSEYLSNPQTVAQYLLDSGRVNQQQIQQANTMYQQFFGGKR